MVSEVAGTVRRQADLVCEAGMLHRSGQAQVDVASDGHTLGSTTFSPTSSALLLKFKNVEGRNHIGPDRWNFSAVRRWGS